MKYDFVIKGHIGSYWAGTSYDTVADFLIRNKDKEVHVAICSPGGYVDEGLAIYQAFRDHGRVHAHIIGMTASIATVIAMGAKTVDMVKGSLILVHNASSGLFAYGSYNKEQLDELIGKCKKTRNDLKTIDELIVSIYADKNGKTIQQNLDKMNVAAWINADDAKAFGLVDSIRDDAEDLKSVANIQHLYVNQVKEFGLPEYPASTITGNGKVDNPTNGLMAALKSVAERFINGVNKNKEEMNEKIKLLLACLGVTSLAFADKKTSITEDQALAIEGELTDLNKKVGELETEKGKAEQELKDAQDEIAKLKEQIKNIEDAPADDCKKTDPGQDTDTDAVNERENMWNAVKDII